MFPGLSWHNSVVALLKLSMKEEKAQEQPPPIPINAKEVTSAMIQNASASGDGSIKRGEEERMGEQKDKALEQKNDNDEGTI